MSQILEVLDNHTADFVIAGNRDAEEDFTRKSFEAAGVIRRILPPIFFKPQNPLKIREGYVLLI